LNCKKTPNPRSLPYMVDRRLLARFKRLLKRTRAKVVLTSTWRYDPAIPYRRSDKQRARLQAAAGSALTMMCHAGGDLWTLDSHTGSDPGARPAVALPQTHTGIVGAPISATGRNKGNQQRNEFSTTEGGLVIGGDPFFTARQEQLAALAVRHAVPTVYENREFIAAGGLIGYGGSITDAYRLVGVYAARFLKGEKPGELPVQQSTKVEMFLNLKAARALGITVPLPLLGRADEVIEFIASGAE
jgi:ABC transporter substrate binding protein